MAAEIEHLKMLIERKISKLHPHDAESHIWYGKFLTLIDENAAEMEQEALFEDIARQELSLAFNIKFNSLYQNQQFNINN
jgi:hypothetical protein